MYQEHIDDPVYPALEIIATVASSSAGEDGNYSAVSSPEDLEPYIDAAEEHDVYVVLDLQPGHADFLSEAKIYEELLQRPNVGLAQDPELRLAKGHVHIQQIGSVAAEDSNETPQWRAAWTDDHDLPQKRRIWCQTALPRNR